MKKFERTGGQTAYSSLGTNKYWGFTNLGRCLVGEVLVENSSADPYITPWDNRMVYKA